MIDRPGWARAWFGLTGLVVLVGLCVQLWDTARLTSGHFATPLTRTLNLLFFFTIDSNIILMLTCLLLGLRLTGWGPTFAVLRLMGVVCIAITGIVYYAVLKDLLDLHGAAYVSDQVLHTVSPLMAVTGWLVFGPRRLASYRVACLVMLFPVVYLAVTLVRGPIVHWYPYPFVDVIAHGYPSVALNCVVVAVLVLAVAFGAAWVDRRLSLGRAAR
ncbi:MAG: hypothetical protein QOF39_3452 [Frankiales bacterium]|nr:hypothetical protein [Frankiales bacterium]